MLEIYILYYIILYYIILYYIILYIILLLEKEYTKLHESNGILTGIIVNMQSNLNHLDTSKRCNNIILSGLPEKNMPGPDGAFVTTEDKQKMPILLHELNLNDYDFLENCHVRRIGKEKPETSRLMKVPLPSTDIHNNEILNNASALKALSESWSKVYMKENKRLSKKMSDLRKKSLKSRKRYQNYEWEAVG